MFKRNAAAFFFLFLAFFFFSGTAFAGAADSLEDIVKKIQGGGGASPSPSPAPNPQIPSFTDSGAVFGKPLASSTDMEGKTTSTYKNADGSYTVVETDRSGVQLSARNFPGLPVLTEAKTIESGSSTFIRINPNGEVEMEPMLEGEAAGSETGMTTSVYPESDGTRTVTTRDADGKVVSTERRGNEPAGGSSADPQTGVTSSVQIVNGQWKVTQKDAEGKVISSTVRNPNGAVGSSSYDAATGITTTSTRNEDGSHTVVKTDASGKIISSEVRGKAKEPADASSFNPVMDITASSYKTPEGGRVISEAAANGAVILSNRAPQNQPAGESWRDLSSGNTASSQNSDGARAVTQTSSDGKGLSQETAGKAR